jgi:hypothetical protein
MDPQRNDVTRDPLWHLAICDMCGQPFKIEDLNQMAKEKGLTFVEDRPRYCVYCCYTPTIDNNEEYGAIVALLRAYYGV